MVRTAALLLALWTGFAGTAQARTIYVDDDAPGDPAPGDPAVSDPLENGSAEHPYDGIQEALTAALAGDTVLVADGIYTGAANRNLDFLGRAVTLRSAGGAVTCVIDCQSLGRGFVFTRGETNATRVEGVTIRNGRAVGSGQNANGGAVYCVGASPSFVDCVVTNNVCGELGGGFYFRNSSFLLAGCTITNNEALPYSSSGGGVYCELGSPLIENCNISFNRIDQGTGGAIRAQGANVVIRNCWIEGNNGDAAVAGGVLLADCTVVRNACRFGVSGVIDVLDSTISENAGCCESNGGVSNAQRVARCLITNNRGGGVQGDYTTAMIVEDCMLVGNTRGVWFRDQGILRVSNCVIRRNQGRDGAGVFGDGSGSTCLIENCVIEENVAPRNGGGVAVQDYPTLTMRNCVLRRNRAAERGGALYAYRGRIVADNCTIRDNDAPQGPVLFAEGATDEYRNARATLRNCIIWQSQPSALPYYLLTGVSHLVVAYCDSQRGVAAVSAVPGSTVSWSGTNFDADPRLVYEDGHLLADSPCRGAGDLNGQYAGQTDIDGEALLAGGAVDVGADQFRDVDADQMPDWFEQAYFGDTQAGDPLADVDGDTLGNAAEYENRRDPLVPPTDYFVSPAGDDGWDGRAPAWDGVHGPKATVQAAVGACSFYEGDRVVLLPGTYTGDGNRDILPDGKEITIRSSDPADPAIVAATVIDCQGTLDAPHRAFAFRFAEGPRTVIDGLTIINGYGIDEDEPGLWTDARVGGAFYAPFASPVIRRCTVRQTTGVGAALCCRMASPLIDRCDFSQNTWEVIYASSSELRVTDTVFRNNVRGSFGVITCGLNSTAEISGCVFDHNGSESIRFTNSATLAVAGCSFLDNDTGTFGSAGSGIAFSNSAAATISDCIFERNRTTTPGGAVFVTSATNVLIERCAFRENSACWGPGVYVEYDSNVTIRDCEFTGNALRACSPTGGGAVRIGSPHSLFTAPALIENCVFRGNRGAEGAAVNCGITTRIVNCSFLENRDSAALYGRGHVLGSLFRGNLNGGAFSNEGSFRDCRFEANQGTNGAGLTVAGVGTSPGVVLVENSAFTANVALLTGGGIASQTRGDARITNCTFTGNSVTNATGRGGAVHASSLGWVTLRNAILHGNTAPRGAELSLDGANAVGLVSYSDVRLGAAGVYRAGGAILQWQAGNLTDPPQFVDADGPDNIPGTDDDDLRLLPYSPCIDAGDPADDFSREPEPDGGRINMGRYGNTPLAETRGWLYIQRYDVTRRTRVGRTLFEYELTLTLRNADTIDLQNVSAELRAGPENMSIVEPYVTLGTIPAGAEVTSLDTFTIRVDRALPIDPAPLSWRVSLSGGGLEMPLEFPLPPDLWAAPATPAPKRLPAPVTLEQLEP